MAPPIQIQVNRLLGLYDANRNGVIDLTAHGPQRAEQVRATATTLRQGDRLTITTTYFSMPKLFEDADRNQDSRITRQELRRIVAKFDANRNGRLDGGREARRFAQAYPEEVLTTSQISYQIDR